MKHVGQLLLLVCALWCAFWWGHLAGRSSASATFQSSTRTDISVMEMLRDDQHHDFDHKMKILIDRRRADVEYWQPWTAPPVAAILLYPVMAPFEHKMLNDIRAVPHGS